MLRERYLLLLGRRAGKSADLSCTLFQLWSSIHCVAQLHPALSQAGQGLLEQSADAVEEHRVEPETHRSHLYVERNRAQLDSRLGLESIAMGGESAARVQNAHELSCSRN